MARNHLVPDRVLCSAAQRAAETWELVSGAFDAHIPVEYLEEIYHATPGMLLTLIHGLPAGEVSVLLVGHNPTFETLALQLAGEGNAEALETMAAKYPTGGLAIIDFHGSEWWNVKPGEGTLRDFIRPKALK